MDPPRGATRARAVRGQPHHRIESRDHLADTPPHPTAHDERLVARRHRPGRGHGHRLHRRRRAHAEVESIIELTADEEAFTLEEIPGETATVTSQLTATTNSISGYTVIVEADDVELLPSDTAANADSIPIEALSVQGNNFTVDRGLLNLGLLGDAVEPRDVHSQDARSADGGDAVSVDYAMQMPSVNADTYSVGLTFTAATNN